MARKGPFKAGSSRQPTTWPGQKSGQCCSQMFFWAAPRVVITRWALVVTQAW